MSASKNMSLFIPHVFPNFTQEYIANAFSNIGHVKRVDFVAKRDRNGKNYNSVYVHFKSFIETSQAYANFSRIMRRDEKVEFYHDNSEYYWIVMPNKATKHVSGERKQRIGLGEVKSVNICTPEKLEHVSVHSTPMKPTYADKLKSNKETLPEPVAISREEAYMNEFFITGISTEEWERREEAKMLNEAFQYANQIMEELTEEEVEKLMNDDNEPLVTIDSRYIDTLEKENMELRHEIAKMKEAFVQLNYAIDNLNIVMGTNSVSL